MKPAEKKPVEELRMSGDAFDRIMGQVLQVKPKDSKAPRKAAKAKPVRKKRAGKK